jgi:hypothetical protein
VLESDFYEVYHDQGDGFMVLQLLSENYQYQTPTQQQLKTWVSTYGLLFPVLCDPNWGIGNLVGNGYIPFYWVVDQERVIHKKGNYLSQFHTIIEQLLGIED